MNARWKLPCGCIVTENEYVSMCVACRTEYDEIHARWAVEHAAQNARPTPSAQEPRP